MLTAKTAGTQFWGFGGFFCSVSVLLEMKDESIY